MGAAAAHAWKVRGTPGRMAYGCTGAFGEEPGAHVCTWRGPGGARVRLERAQGAHTRRGLEVHTCAWRGVEGARVHLERAWDYRKGGEGPGGRVHVERVPMCTRKVQGCECALRGVHTERGPGCACAYSCLCGPEQERRLGVCACVLSCRRKAGSAHGGVCRRFCVRLQPPGPSMPGLLLVAPSYRELITGWAWCTLSPGALSPAGACRARVAVD